MKHITQYKNRKLYLNQESRYTNLDELKGMLQSGEHIQVTDAVSNEDVTPHILSQILVKTKYNNVELVRQLIMKGE